MKGLITINEKSSKKESVFDIKGVHIRSEAIADEIYEKDSSQEGSTAVTRVESGLYLLTHFTH